MTDRCKGCGKAIEQPRTGRRLWCSERCRKAQYAGTCSDCGGPTNGTTPGRGLPERCQECAQSRFAERNERIFTAWEDGATGIEIAQREGLTETAVLSLINMYRRHGKPLSLHRVVNRQRWPEIQRLLGEGRTHAEIAERIGITRWNVSAHIKNMRGAGVLERRAAA